MFFHLLCDSVTFAGRGKFGLEMALLDNKI